MLTEKERRGKFVEAEAALCEGLSTTALCFYKYIGD